MIKGIVILLMISKPNKIGKDLDFSLCCYLFNFVSGTPNLSLKCACFALYITSKMLH